MVLIESLALFNKADEVFMTKQECIQTMDIALKYLGWEGGTVHQVVNELRRRTGVERTTTFHVYIRDMLIELGVMR